jgi:hypothetical protein
VAVKDSSGSAKWKKPIPTPSKNATKYIISNGISDINQRIIVPALHDLRSLPRNPDHDTQPARQSSMELRGYMSVGAFTFTSIVISCRIGRIEFISKPVWSWCIYRSVFRSRHPTSSELPTLVATERIVFFTLVASPSTLAARRISTHIQHFPWTPSLERKKSHGLDQKRSVIYLNGRLCSSGSTTRMDMPSNSSPRLTWARPG